MRSWHQPAHHANAHQDDHDDDDGQYQLHRDFVWTSVGHWSSSPQIPRLKPPWATRSAALAFPVRRSSARHRNDRGMHRRWRYPGNRSEYRATRPRVGSGRAGLRLLRRKPRHSRLRCARALRCARFGFHGFLSERKFSIHKVPLSSEVRRLKQLETENVRLKKLVAERDLEIEIMKDQQVINNNPGAGMGSGHLRIPGATKWECLPTGSSWTPKGRRTTPIKWKSFYARRPPAANPSLLQLPC
jgi:hypothetical protein